MWLWILALFLCVAAAAAATAQLSQQVATYLTSISPSSLLNSLDNGLVVWLDAAQVNGSSTAASDGALVPSWQNLAQPNCSFAFLDDLGSSGTTISTSLGEPAVVFSSSRAQQFVLQDTTTGGPDGWCNRTMFYNTSSGFTIVAAAFWTSRPVAMSMFTAATNTTAFDVDSCAVQLAAPPTAWSVSTTRPTSLSSASNPLAGQFVTGLANASDASSPPAPFLFWNQTANNAAASPMDAFSTYAWWFRDASPFAAASTAGFPLAAVGLPLAERNISIGSSDISANALKYAGYLSEMIVYNRALSSDEMDYLHQYYAARYGMYYDSTAYGNMLQNVATSQALDAAQEDHTDYPSYLALNYSAALSFAALSNGTLVSQWPDTTGALDFAAAALGGSSQAPLVYAFGGGMTGVRLDSSFGQYLLLNESAAVDALLGNLTDGFTITVVGMELPLENGSFAQTQSGLFGLVSSACGYSAYAMRAAGTASALELGSFAGDSCDSPLPSGFLVNQGAWDAWRSAPTAVTVRVKGAAAQLLVLNGDSGTFALSLGQTSGRKLVLGAIHESASVHNSSFNGVIAQILVFNKTLSDSAISALHAQIVTQFGLSTVWTTVAAQLTVNVTGGLPVNATLNNATLAAQNGYSAPYQLVYSLSATGSPVQVWVSSGGVWSISAQGTFTQDDLDNGRVQLEMLQFANATLLVNLTDPSGAVLQATVPLVLIGDPGSSSTASSTTMAATSTSSTVDSLTLSLTSSTDASSATPSTSSNSGSSSDSMTTTWSDSSMSPSSLWTSSSDATSLSTSLATSTSDASTLVSSSTDLLSGTFSTETSTFSSGSTASLSSSLTSSDVSSTMTDTTTSAVASTTLSTASASESSSQSSSNAGTSTASSDSTAVSTASSSIPSSSAGVTTSDSVPIDYTSSTQDSTLSSSTLPASTPSSTSSDSTSLASTATTLASTATTLSSDSLSQDTTMTVSSSEITSSTMPSSTDHSSTAVSSSTVSSSEITSSALSSSSSSDSTSSASSLAGASSTSSSSVGSATTPLSSSTTDASSTDTSVSLTGATTSYDSTDTAQVASSTTSSSATPLSSSTSSDLYMSTPTTFSSFSVSSSSNSNSVVTTTAVSATESSTTGPATFTSPSSGMLTSTFSSLTTQSLSTSDNGASNSASSGTATAYSTTATSSTASASAAAVGQEAASSSGLSSAGVAGIGAAGGLAAVASVAVVGYFLRHSKRSQSGARRGSEAYRGKPADTSADDQERGAAPQRGSDDGTRGGDSAIKRRQSVRDMGIGSPVNLAVSGLSMGSKCPPVVPPVPDHPLLHSQAAADPSVSDPSSTFNSLQPGDSSVSAGMSSSAGMVTAGQTEGGSAMSTIDNSTTGNPRDARVSLLTSDLPASSVDYTPIASRPSEPALAGTPTLANIRGTWSQPQSPSPSPSAQQGTSRVSRLFQSLFGRDV